MLEFIAKPLDLVTEAVMFLSFAEESFLDLFDLAFGGLFCLSK